MRSLVLNIAALVIMVADATASRVEFRKTGEAAARPTSPCQRHARTRAGSRNATASRLLDWRRFGWRRWRRTIERHPIDGIQHGKPNFSVLAVLVAVLFEQRDRRDLAVMLPAVEPVTDQINHQDDGFDAAVGRRLEDHLDAGISAVEALQVNGPLLLPRKSYVLHIRDQRLRLADGDEV